MYRIEHRNYVIFAEGEDLGSSSGSGSGEHGRSAQSEVKDSNSRTKIKGFTLDSVKIIIQWSPDTKGTDKKGTRTPATFL